MRKEPVILSSPQESAAVHATIQELASFRYKLRKFLRFSERAARQFGVTPQQHQLMLGVAGFTGRGTASITELAEFLQERHHSVTELIERAVQNGLVAREQGLADRRVVIVTLTCLGEETLRKLSTLHQEEMSRLKAGFLNLPEASASAQRNKRRRLT
ncbi:MAG: MarR family transcriptional regulator [Acidobacteriota bacterium]|nr:MarR family transcriptional regulator [Acidobacteriota bacterium]